MMRLNKVVFILLSGINYCKSPITGQYTNSCVPSVCSALTAGNTNLVCILQCDINKTLLHGDKTCTQRQFSCSGSPGLEQGQLRPASNWGRMDKVMMV